jgi:hypothetical protein
MAISFVCQCGAEFRVKDEFAGRQTKCRNCGRALTIPSPGPVEFKLPPLPEVVPDDAGPEFPEFDDGDDLERPSASKSSRRRENSSSPVPGMSRDIGIILLAAGLFLVVLSRTSESVFNRSAARTQARYQLAQADSDEYDETELTELRDSANNANANVMAWGFWLSWPFMIGTLMLTHGLLVLAFTGQPIEQRVCVVMIAIITFSLYVGGFAWFDSIANSNRSALGP